MPFTDDELGRFKNFLNKYPYVNLEHFPLQCVELLHLVDRLEMAEKFTDYANHTYHCAALTHQGQCECDYDRNYSKWKKASGKE